MTRKPSKETLSCWISSMSLLPNPSEWWKFHPKYGWFTSPALDWIQLNGILFILMTDSTNRSTLLPTTESAKSTWWCATAAMTIVCAAFAILTADGTKNPIRANLTHLGISFSPHFSLIFPNSFRSIYLFLFARLLQDVPNTTPGICDACIAKKRLLVTWGQAVHLSCAIKLPEPMSSLPVTWFYYSRERGQYQLSFR